MVKYSFSLRLKSTNDEYTYSINLDYAQENSPEKVFTKQVREDIRSHLQKESLCAIKENDLNLIVQTWIQDIREGERKSTLILNLPLLIESNIENLHEPGNQNIPAIINPNFAQMEPHTGMLPPLDFV